MFAYHFHPTSNALVHDNTLSKFSKKTASNSQCENDAILLILSKNPRINLQECADAERKSLSSFSCD